MPATTLLRLEVEPGVRLAAQASSDVADRAKPAILFANSLAADMSMWDDVSSRLAGVARLVCYDMRGHGRSDAPPGPYSLERLGLDALATLNVFGIDKAIVCGLSLGGLVAQWLAIHRPERVSCLVLANTTAAFPPASLWRERAKAALTSGVEPFVKPTLGRWLTSRFQCSNPARTDETSAMIRGTSRLGYVGCCAVLAATDLNAELRLIQHPALIIVGAQDPSATPEQGSALAAGIAGAELIEVDAAHMSAIEAPDEFAHSVSGFVRAVGAENL